MENEININQLSGKEKTCLRNKYKEIYLKKHSNINLKDSSLNIYYKEYMFNNAICKINHTKCYKQNPIMRLYLEAIKDNLIIPVHISINLNKSSFVIKINNKKIISLNMTFDELLFIMENKNQFKAYTTMAWERFSNIYYEDILTKGYTTTILSYLISNNDYDKKQIQQLKEGLISQIDITKYFNSNFDYRQMFEIKVGLEDNIDVSSYANDGFNYMQIHEIRLGIQNGVNVKKYANINYSSSQMRELRLGLENKINIDLYNDIKIPPEKMEATRKALERGVSKKLLKEKNLKTLKINRL